MSIFTTLLIYWLATGLTIFIASLCMKERPPLLVDILAWIMGLIIMFVIHTGG